MAKFIKSIFSPPAPEKMKSTPHSEPEAEGESPVGDRRKLSMSRSGRLKHAYKKRHSLSMELYGNEDDLQQQEKPKSMEYHVNSTPVEPKQERKRRSIDAAIRNGSKSPEEEIDSAFEVIDKS